MTSQYATDAYVPINEEKHSLAADRDGNPLQGQVPLTVATITATGTLPARCPDVIILSNAAAITLTMTSLANLVGRRITFVNDVTNTPAHIITFPANSINGASRTITFTAANADSLATVLVVSPTRVIAQVLTHATLS